MKRFVLIFVLLVFGASFAYADDVPSEINYQGYVTSGGSAYDGTGYFKFKLVNNTDEEGHSYTYTYWSNDGTQEGADTDPPDAAISTTVSSGVFNTILGDTDITHMTALHKTDFSYDGARLYLKVWFSTDNVTFEGLTPNKELTASGYAINCDAFDNTIMPSLTLDSDSTGPSTQNITVVAKQGTDTNYGILKYDGTNNIWQYSNNGGTSYANFASGTGDITAVGSVTSGDAFNSSATASGKWLGIGESAGRIGFTDGDITDYVNILGANVGIGDISPVALLTVGDGDLFQVNSSGAIVAAAGITSSGTINFLGLTGSKSVFTDGSKNLTSTGTLGVDQGGTGITSYAIGDLLYASASGTLSKLADVATGSVLMSAGVGVAPTWGAFDHGSLGGLTDDDHAQYALLAGRTGAGGQILRGGTGTIDDLTLRATFGAGVSGSDIIFGVGTDGGTEAMRILYDGKVGIGDTTPDNLLEILSSGAANTQLSITNTNDANYNAQIGFQLVDGTNFFTIGVDDSDSDKFKIGVNSLESGTFFAIDPRNTISGVSAITITGVSPTIASVSDAEYTTLTIAVPSITLTGTTEVTSQMDSINITQPTITDSSAITVDDATTLTIAGPPTASGLVTIAETYGLKIVGGPVSGATTAYSLYVDGPTGSTNNYSAVFMNGRVGIGTSAPACLLDIKLDLPTNTAGTYYGMRTDLDSTGVFTSGATHIYGVYGDAAATGVSTGGTVNTYGGYFTATGESTGTAGTKAYGLYVNGASGADSNYSAVFMNGRVGIGTSAPVCLLTVMGPASFNAPSTKTGAYSMVETDSSLIFNGTANIILTLQNASNDSGRILYVKTIAAHQVNSASANVAPRDSGTPGIAILPSTAGAWAMLQSDGTNWVIMAGS